MSLNPLPLLSCKEGIQEGQYSGEARHGGPPLCSYCILAKAGDCRWGHRGREGAAFRAEIHVNSALVLSQRCLVRVCLPTKPPCRSFMTPKSSGSVRCLGDVHSMTKERCVSCVRGTSYFLRVGLGAEGQG